MSFLQRTGDYFLLHIKTNPNSSKNKIGDIFCDEKNQEYLKISVSAVAEDGKANDELIIFLSKTIKVPKSKIEILRGHNSRLKLLKINADFKALSQIKTQLLKPQDNDPKLFLDL